jgi:hypothetical protein
MSIFRRNNMSSNITKEKAIEIATQMIKDNPPLPYPILSVTAVLDEDYGTWMVRFILDIQADPGDIMIEVDISTGEAWYFVHP